MTGIDHEYCIDRMPVDTAFYKANNMDSAFAFYNCHNVHKDGNKQVQV
jgi:hypothetical protein